MKVIEYDSFEKVFLVFYGGEFSENDFTQGDFVGSTSDGQDVVSSWEALKVSATIAGVWGFVIDGVIHAWMSPDVKFDQLLHFFAHELGHATGAPSSDDLEEELRAESYAEVAIKAVELANKFKGR